MEKWFIQTKKADFESWSRDLGIDVVTARVLRNRDILTAEEARSFLGGSVNEMHDPFLMKDTKRAAEEIPAAVNAGKSIRVIGDYDVDGVTSAYILTKGIKAIGGNVSTAIPHRVKDGYGLNDALVNDAAADGVKLIVTCDNGIAAAAQVELAVSLGMDVIVTDHHEVPFDEEEGDFGRLLIRKAGIDVGVYTAKEREDYQKIVDKEDSAVAVKERRDVEYVIADRRSQGFDLTEIREGDCAYLIRGRAEIMKYTCSRVCIGTNTGNDVVDDEENSLFRQNEGGLCAYSSAGQEDPAKVIVTFWEPDDSSEEESE